MLVSKIQIVDRGVFILFGGKRLLRVLPTSWMCIDIFCIGIDQYADCWITEFLLSAADVDRPWTHGNPIWVFGSADVVGILLGCYGACHLLRNLRNYHGHVRLLLCDETRV